ncbi:MULTISPECIES: hypothetical protein [unclassified Chryseobacterium]|uniref:hypothetical protein n=1 Tax=unclassified Chryseobacterium TaxID=2593645 RepID=UPI00100B3B6A|nr:MULTISPECIES: hypothetical protein [unclassified Chryseobacterium]RXM51828.1 hypothetical protein BOQ64_11690 [Chryseobacterium sp. CH25]RXM67437.1 hypothetical protein BOQ60_04405 [Chryseobacterium sp. CH1]
MLHKAIIFSLGIFALTGCDAQKKAKTESKTPEMTTNTNSDDQKKGIIYLSEGENKFLKDYQMNITFKGISEDSRCPEGVNCMWAGIAMAQVEVMGIATRPVLLNLASMDFPSRNYHQSADFNGYTITLKEVTPYPKTEGAKALKGKYKIAVDIKKAEASSDATTK